MRLHIVLAFILFTFSCMPFKAADDVVFFHGLGASGKHASYYKNRGLFPHMKVTCPDMPDSPFYPGNDDLLNYRQTSLGQGEEKRICERAVKDIRKKKRKRNDRGKVLAFCVSRGGICGANGTYDVDAMVFESNPADIKDAVGLELKRFGLGWVPGLSFLADRLVVPWIYRKYNPAGDKPLKNLSNIPSDRPLLFVYTPNDDVIPASSTVRFAEELKRSGHDNIYMWKDQSGSDHSLILLGPDNGHEYKCAVNAFLAKTGFDHTRKFAKEGKKFLTKPTLQELTKIRKELQWSEWKRYWGRNAVTLLSTVATAAYLLTKFSGSSNKNGRIAKKVLN